MKVPIRISEKVATAHTAISAAGLSGYMKGFDPGGSAQKYRDAAADVWPVRESYLSLLTDLRSETISPLEGAKRRDELQQRLATIYKTTPQTTPRAYQQENSISGALLSILTRMDSFIEDRGGKNVDR